MARVRNANIFILDQRVFVVLLEDDVVLPPVGRRRRGRRQQCGRLFRRGPRPGRGRGHRRRRRGRRRHSGAGNQRRPEKTLLAFLTTFLRQHFQNVPYIRGPNFELSLISGEFYYIENPFPRVCLLYPRIPYIRVAYIPGLLYIYARPDKNE